jgi:hypothetical protein
MIGCGDALRKQSKNFVTRMARPTGFLPAGLQWPAVREGLTRNQLSD